MTMTWKMENYSIGNSWIRPSKATTDNEDGDDNVVDFFFEDDSSTDSTNSKEKDDTPIHFDVGIDGRMMETGPLSLKMYQAIQSRSSMVAKNNNNNNNNDPILTRTIYELILKTTAQEAVKVTLQQSGLQLALDNNNNDLDGWGMIESIRVEPDDDDDDNADGPTTTYDSWDSLLTRNDDGNGVWKPGQSFSFVLRNVPTFRKAVSMDELLSSLDPDGNLRNQALDAGILEDQDDNDDDDNEVELEEYYPVTSLKELFEDNYRRVEQSPRAVDAMDHVYTGTRKGGYRIIHARDLLSMVGDINNRLDRNEAITANVLKQYKNSTMLVMDAFVSHGCLVVDVTDGGDAKRRADLLHQMWQVTESFYRNVASNVHNHTALPSWEPVAEAGSVHAKVGYQSLNNGTMSVLETRQRFADGQLLPVETTALFGLDGSNSMRQAFDVITELCQAAIQVAVGASTQEIYRVDGTTAMTGARRLVHELVDNGKALSTEVPNSDNSFPVSMTPHRLLQYGMEPSSSNDDAEIFGAHTDTTFITAVPVASVAGLEVYDEAVQLWYRPELAVQQQQLNQSHIDDNTLPWYTRYVVLMPGELLQIATCNEVPAAVHRVIDGSRTINQESRDGTCTPLPLVRYSTPVLLRGRSGVVFDGERYFGLPPESATTWPVWSECERMTMDQIYSALQGKPPNK